MGVPQFDRTLANFKMLIINAFLRFTTLALRRFRGRCKSDDQNDRPPNESTELMSQGEEGINHSLTTGFNDFSHSKGAFALCAFHAAIYYSLAVLGFSFLVEKWDIADSLYFATIVFTTVGFGDLYPSTPYARAYCIALAVYGIVILGIFIGIIGEALVEGHNREMLKKHKELQTTVIDALSDGSKSTNLVPEDPNVQEALRASQTKQKPVLQEVKSIIALEAPIVLVVLLFSLLLGYHEGWSVFDSAYWMTTTGSTIGFGDLSPQKSTSRIACCFLVPLTVAILGEFLARIASVYMDRKTRQAEEKFLQRSLTLCDLQVMDTNKDGGVEKSEFLAYMLVALQKVKKEDVDELLTLFDRLDVARNGILTKDDLQRKGWDNSFRRSIEHNHAKYLNVRS